MPAASMAPFNSLRNVRRPSKSASTSVTLKQTYGEINTTTDPIACERQGLIVLPVLVLSCSIAVFALSMYGLVVFPAIPPTQILVEIRTRFPSEILVCSLCLAFLCIVTVIYQVVSRKVQWLHNCFVVFGLYLALLIFSVGTLAGFSYRAASLAYFEGVKVFYGLIGLLIALIVLIVIYMILSGNPFANHKRSHNSSSNIAQPMISPPTIRLTEASPVQFDGGNDSPKSKTTSLTQPDMVHYNPVDPYHPLRLNPPEYSPAMEPTGPPQSQTQQPNPVTKTPELSSNSLTQGLQTLRGSGILRWVSWAKEGDNNENTKT